MAKLGYHGSRDCNSIEDAERYLREWLDSDPKVVAVDVETVSLNSPVPIGIGMAASKDEAFYFPLFPEVSTYVPWKLLLDPTVTKIMHNALFDLSALWQFHAERYENIVDTMVMANLANLPMELSDLAAYLVGLEIKTISDVLPKGKSMLDLPEYVVADKCCWDVRATMAVYPKLLEMVDSEYLKMELGLIPILVRMSVRGLKVDQVVRDELENKYRQEVNFYLEIAEAQGFNPGSPQQVGYMLANRGNILEVRRRGFRKSLVTDENALRKLKDPLAAVVLNYRKAKYVLSHYIEPLRGKDRAYTRFHMFASTGRISSTDMNMQNFPPDVRGMIVPDSGVFTKFDYSQQELRTLAYMSQDKDMLEIYERGGDIHQETADFMGVPRRVAKNVTFAMVYGGSPDVIMETAGIEDRDLAVRLQQVWFGKYKGAARWIREIQEFGLRRGWVETILGRRLQLQRRFDRELSDKEVRNRAVNYPIQGSAAEITKLAMLRLKDMPIALQIHDELVIDGDVEVPREIEHVYKFHTPIEVRRASRWE